MPKPPYQQRPVTEPLTRPSGVEAEEIFSPFSIFRERRPLGSLHRPGVFPTEHPLLYLMLWTIFFADNASLITEKKFKTIAEQFQESVSGVSSGKSSKVCNSFVTSQNGAGVE